VILKDTHNSYVHTDDAALCVIGLDDVFVVATKDAVLVAARDKAQAVKEMVAELKARGRGEVAVHSRVYRPWGWYEGLSRGDRFQVKCLMVKPGGRLSLQSHHHRSEHWVVVSGTARVTVDDDVRLLTENQSTYIPLGARHRLENPGKVGAYLIEVQSGRYLEEDDIVRYEDVYNRG
jgi:mannose-1-phosphate guanylyltransferase/mannose-6-phosphate isomerase